MTTQKYKSLLVIIWALWAFHPCLAIDDVLRTAKRDAILAQITGAVRPKKQISLISFGAKGDGKKDCKPAFDKAMKRAAPYGRSTYCGSRRGISFEWSYSFCK